MRFKEAIVQCKFCKRDIHLKKIWGKVFGEFCIQGKCKCGADISFGVEFDVMGRPPEKRKK